MTINGSTGRTIQEIAQKERLRTATDEERARIRDAEIEAARARQVEAARKRELGEAHQRAEIAREAAWLENEKARRAAQIATYQAEVRELAGFLAPVWNAIEAGEDDLGVTPEARMAAVKQLLQICRAAAEQAETAERRLQDSRPRALLTVPCHEPSDGAFVVFRHAKEPGTQDIVIGRERYRLAPGPNFLSPTLEDLSALDHFVTRGVLSLHPPGTAVPQMTADERSARAATLAELGLESEL